MLLGGDCRDWPDSGAKRFAPATTPRDKIKVLTDQVGSVKTGSRASDWLMSLIQQLTREEDLGQVLRGVGVAMGIRVSATAISYLLMVFLARWLGAFDFGLYMFAIALVTLLMLPATLGLGIASVKFIPSYLARADWTAVRSLLQRSTELVFAASVVIALLAAGTIRVVMSEGPYTETTLLAVVALPLWAFASLFSDIARGFGWITLAYAPAQRGTAVLTLLAAAGLLAARALNATHLVIGTIVAYGVIVLVQVGFLVRRLWPQLRDSSSEFPTAE
jgi:O-antigen/teichoic acid export membrane protein